MEKKVTRAEYEAAIKRQHDLREEGNRLAMQTMDMPPGIEKDFLAALVEFGMKNLDQGEKSIAEMAKHLEDE